MRCPKCQYISFDNGERCRNCGYEFSLAVDDPSVDLTIRPDEPGPGPPHDIGLTTFDSELPASRSWSDPDRQTERGGGRAAIAPTDLPLFTDRVADDQAPLVSAPAVPRAPLSVRRANPAGRPRPRVPEPEELPLDLAAEPDEDEPEREQPAAAYRTHSPRPAGVTRRVAAGLIDLAILGAIQATVIYLTLRLCELRVDEWRMLPLPPLIGFLLLLSGGYFILFTAAGGQTIGKMAARIRVIPSGSADDGVSRVSFGTAFIRAVACLGSVVLLGGGFLPVLFTADRRALHDRVADTRVVTA